MTQITSFLQNLVANLDLSLPWLLPTLEAIETAFPATTRVLISVPLIAWLAVRHYQAASAGRLHGVAF